MNCKYLFAIGVSAVVTVSVAAPTVVVDAAVREAIRQDTTWTSENIQAHPDLFIQDQIRQCDILKRKVEAQSISMTRVIKEASRKVEEADYAIARYTRLLVAFNAAYDSAEKSGKWPVTVNGYEMDEDELGDKMEDAQSRIDLAKKDKKQNEAIGKKGAIRQGVLKKKKREVASLRLKLVQQAEQVKMNMAFAEIENLKDVLGTIKDMMVDIDEDPTKLSVEDMTEKDPAAEKKARIRAIRANAREARQQTESPK